jgi:BA14K-like protein
MEPTMISLKVLSTVAAMTLVLPMVAPSVSFAQSNPGKAGGGVARGGGSGVSRGAPPAARYSGGGSPGPRYSGGGGGGGNWQGGGGYRRGDGGGGFIPGAVAGAVIGGALASSGYGYYGGGPGYYAPGYYDDQVYDDSVAVAPQGGDDGVAYCMQTYRSYDPQSGTYMGNDGYRHPCP